MDQVWVAAIIFLVSYAIIISEKINRAVVALCGAGLMVIAGILDIEDVYGAYIEWDTIILLIGMMILVGITQKTGVFQFVAIRAAKWCKGHPLYILVMLSLLTAVASAFLDNVTTVLLMVPVTFSITRILGTNPVPYLISEIIASNIGGTATLIGDPPNIMIGTANAHLDFVSFIANLGPIVVVIMAVTTYMLYAIYRKQLKPDTEKMAALMEIDERSYITDKPLLIKSLVILGLTLIGFLLHAVIHVEAAVVAMMGATLLMLFGTKSEHQVEEALDAVEWVTIFFFAGLFALVGGLQEAGIIKALAGRMLDVTGGDIGLAATLILWVSGVASATIDNIPFVATMIPMIREMAEGLGLATDSQSINALWWSLALGACLGGNGTIIGASANVIVAGLAAKEGKGFSYWEFLKIGAPITLVSLLIAYAYVYFRYIVYLS